MRKDGTYSAFATSPRRKIDAWTMCFSIWVLIAGCGGAEFQQWQGLTMGTYYRVSFGMVNGCQVSKNEIEDIFTAVNQTMSTYLEASELSRFNHSAATSWQPVSAQLFEVIETAAEVAQQSDGAFDVTVGPLVNLWGFGANSSEVVPSTAEQAIVAAVVGMDKIELASLRIRKLLPSVFVDLSALAKGYAVDQVSLALSQQNCHDHMVDVGGEIKLAGENRHGELWRIGVEVPKSSQMGESRMVLNLTDLAVATSGDYRNFRMVDGKKVHHVFDPRSGLPTANSVVSVTVVHPQAMWADAYATAIMVLGEQAGMAMAAEHDFAVYIMSRDAEKQGRAQKVVGRYNLRMQPYLSVPDLSTPYPLEPE